MEGYVSLVPAGELGIVGVIEITCKPHTTVPIEKLKWFQGKLAETTKDRLTKLKNSIKKHGIFMAFSVWDDGGTLNIVDGHARKAALEELGYDGLVPVNFVLAESYKDAKEKVLLARSQTNTTTEEGLYEFVQDLDWNELTQAIDLPNIDLEQFTEGWINDNVLYDGNAVKEYDENIKCNAKCPKCGYEWNERK